MPLFLRGNPTQTTQHCFSNLQRSKFPYGCAKVANLKKLGRKRSNVYEANEWLWRFGRGRPSLGVCQCLRQRYCKRL